MRTRLGTVSQEPVTLYGERHLDSPFVFTAFVALLEKRVPFAFRLLDLTAGATRTPEFAERSLTARVPTLDVGAFSLSESAAIVEYLEEAFPPPAHARVLPVSIEERARARQVLGWLRSDLTSLRQERPTSSIFFEPVTTPLGDKARGDADKLVRVALTLLGDRATLFETWSIADADLTLALMRLVANGDALPAPLRDYAQAQWQRPSIARFLAFERPATIWEHSL